MKISVIVPVYKVEKTLKQCVYSILNQTYEDYEIILVDDGSPDSSGEICDMLQAEDERIKVVHKENGGLSSARNAGLDVAAGEYVCFIDSDDYISEKYLELLLQVADKEGADLVIGGYQEVYASGEYKNISLPYKCYGNIDAVKELWRQDNAVLYVIACNKLYHRSLWVNERFDVGRIHEDEFLAHRMLYKSKKTVMIEDIIYFYVQNDASITHNKGEKSYGDTMDAFVQRAEYFDINSQTELAAKSYEELCKYIVYAIFDKCYEMKNLRKRALRLYRKNFRFLLNSDTITPMQKRGYIIYYVSPFVANAAYRFFNTYCVRKNEKQPYNCN